MSIEEMSAEMVKVRQLTSRPFGIDLLAPNTNKPEEESAADHRRRPSCLVTDVDMPSKVIRLCREAGVLVFYVCSTVRHAILAEQAGCDAIIAQGTEAGGHTGAVGTMALVPQVVDNVKVPVIAAGGIYDGRGLAAALALGGEGVWVGTRFVACAEARGADAYKDAILRERKRYDPLALLDRQAAAALKNPTIEQWEENPQEIRPFPQQEETMQQAGLLGFLYPDDARRDPHLSCFPAGQGCGGITKIDSCRSIVEAMMRQAEEALTALGRRVR